METTTVPAEQVGGLSAKLCAAFRPAVEGWLELPLVAGIARGDADPDAFRNYVEQDFIYLRNYMRLYARLAALAPEHHVEHLVTLAWNIGEHELGLHRSFGVPFGADFEGVTPSPVCADYMRFLLDAADDFGLGLVASLPCAWGYAEVATMMPLPPEGPFRRWAETYRSERGRELLARHCQMIDEAAPDPVRAEELFARAMDLEVEFWNQHLTDCRSVSSTSRPDATSSSPKREGQGATP
jgi:thiaminase (transcriptional activator TenA)